MTSALAAAAPPETRPLNLNTYDRSPSLSHTEQVALVSVCSHRFQMVPAPEERALWRLLAPIVDVLTTAGIPDPTCARRIMLREGHELSLGAEEALTIETYRECPCCDARRWISVPSVGAILDAAAALGAGRVPDFDIELTRREQQVLNVLHRSPYPLRHEQLAALLWSEPDRTHDVRSVLYRLRRKLRTSGWLIPFPPKGRGVRLVRDATEHPQAGAKSDGYEPGGESDIKLGSAA